MEAIINTIIRPQNFEVVRDVIGAILVTELTQQKQLQNFEELVEVYSERITPISDSEDLYINVLLDSGVYSSQAASSSQGGVLYFIDVYTNGSASGDNPGTSESTNRLHKFIGMVRYILSYTGYNTLGLPAGFIGGTSIESFATLDPSLKEDSSYSRFARLQFRVRMVENQQLWDGVPLKMNFTTVKLQDTDKGHKYVFENN